MKLKFDIFPSFKTGEKLCGFSGVRTGVLFSGENVRLVILRDDGPDHRIMYDSLLETGKLPPEKQPGVKKTGILGTRFQKGPCCAKRPPVPPQTRNPPSRQSSEHKLLGEMMFGGIPMTSDRGSQKTAFKVHTIRTPPEILLTQVFVPTKTPPGRSDSLMSEHEYFDSLSIHSMAGENTPAQRISGADTYDNPLAMSVPMDVPSPPKHQPENEDSGISGSAQSTPLLSSVDSSSSLNSNSYNSMKRRFKRNRSTSLENLRAVSDDFEGGPPTKKVSKYGMCIVFSLPEDQTEACRHFELFFFSHITLLEFHMNKLRCSVEQALGARNKEKATEALELFRTSVCDLYMAPRLSQPVWLSMMAASSHRLALCNAFIKEFMTLVTKYDTKSTKFFVSNLITAVLCNHLAWVPTVTPAGATPARTYLDKHSAKWLNALAKSHPYNPLWAQLSDLYGAVGFPLRQARTVVTGRREDVVRRFLHMLSYFMRCSDLHEAEPRRDEAQDSRWLETGGTQRSMTPIIESLQSRQNSTADMEAFLHDSIANTTYSLDLHGDATEDTMKKSSDSDEPLTSSCKCTKVNCLSKSPSLCMSSTTLKSSESRETVTSETSAQTLASCPCDKTNCVMIQSSGSASKSEVQKDATSDDVVVDPAIIKAKVQKLFRLPQQEFVSEGSSVKEDTSEQLLSGDVCEKTEKSVDSVVMESSKVPEATSEHVDCELKEGRVRISFRDDPMDVTPSYLHRFPTLELSRHLGKDASTYHSQPDIPTAVRSKCVGFTTEPSTSEVITKGRTSSIEVFNDSSHQTESDSSEQDAKKRLEKMKAVRDSISYSRTNSQFDDYFNDEEPIDIAQNLDTEPDQPQESQESCDVFPEISLESSGSLHIGDSCEMGSAMEIEEEYFSPVEHGCDEANDMVHSTLSLMRQNLSTTELDVDGSDWLEDSGEGVLCVSGRQSRCSLGSQSTALSRQTSIQSAPVRCRSITPTELALRRQSSSCTQEPESPDVFDSLVELPMPCSEDAEDSKPLSGFECNLGRSLLGGYTDHYMSDFVLHGTSATQFSFMDKLHSDLTMAVQNPVLDEPTAEAVCIVADTDNYTVRLLTSQYATSDRVSHHELPASRLVSSIVESVHDLWKLKMSPEFCLMHLEDRLQEIYFKSCALSQYIKEHKKMNPGELAACLSVDVSDIPLLLAVAGTHTPQLAFGLL